MGAQLFTATYDEANGLTAITLNGEAFTLLYDDNGNLAWKTGQTSGTTSDTSNARNQLIALSGPAGNANFKYDAFGRRIEKTVYGQTTGFIYDGAQALAELKGAAIDTIYHTGLMIDEVLARYAPSGNRTLLTDALMSVIAQANDNQTVANSYAYSAYGETVTLGSDNGNSLQYTGRENDGAGLYYYRARYYDPVLKRFISEDPIGVAGGLNLVAYVSDNPIIFMDPFGLQFVGGGTGGASSGLSAGGALGGGAGVPGRKSGPTESREINEALGYPSTPSSPSSRSSSTTSSSKTKDDCCRKKFEECHEKGLDRPRPGGAGICLQCMRMCQGQSGVWPPGIYISVGGSLDLWVRCE